MGQGQIQGVPNLPRMAVTNMENQIRELKVQVATMQDMLLNRAEARKPKNEVKAKLNMTIKAIKTRQYPELEVGSHIKVMRKKGSSEKEKTSHWLKEIKTAKKIETKLGQKYYFLDGDTVGYLRHELLKARYEHEAQDYRI